MLEKQIEDEFVAWLHEQGGLCLKLTEEGQRGFPDRTCIFDGKVIFLEFKAPGGNTSWPQKRRIESLRGHGVGAWVVDSVEAAKRIAVIELDM